MPGFRGPNPYAGTAGADLENAPSGPVPFTGIVGLPVTRISTWHAGGNQPGVGTGGVPGEVTGKASGNPNVTTDAKDVPKRPYGGGPNNEAASQFGVPRPLNVGQEVTNRTYAGPVGGANDKLITRDRHGMFKVGYENSGRNSGITDPPMDGPARPSLWLVQRSLTYQMGTDTTAATDDLERDYSRNDTGMYVGEQGTGWAPVYGGVPGLWQEYGSYAGISPSTPGYDPETGDTAGIHSSVAQGAPGDGQHKVWSGPPHGLHSPTLPAYSQTIGRYMAIPQMARPRIDRPSNSTIAGQSYSQLVQPQGQTGTIAAQEVRGRARFNTRQRGNGWRGRAAGG